MRIGSVLGLLLMGGSVAYSQSAQDVIQLNREAIETQKNFLVSGSMELTEEEAQAFWPLYNQYQVRLRAANARADALVVRYVDAYHTLGDAEGQKILDEWVAIEEERLLLKETYMAKMIEVLPARRVVRYFQLENKMDAVFDYDLSQRIPLAR